MTTVYYQWYWYDDHNWIAYAKAQNDNFEAEYAKNTVKDIKVDNDRYIDLSLGYNDIVTNFTGINDKDLIGIQRRYDDKMKRRAVKRSKVSVAASTDYLKGLRFCFFQQQIDSKKSKETETCSEQIKIIGGKISVSLSSKCNFMLVHPSDISNTAIDATKFNSIIENAEKDKVVVIDSTFVASCINSKKKVDHTPFIVSKKVVPKPTAAATTTTTSTKKTTAATTTTKKDEKKQHDIEYLLALSEWAGVCKSDDDQYIMSLKVETLTDGSNADTKDITGTINWPTIDNAITKFKGTVKKTGQFAFTEYELVQGNEDEIELPNDYTADVYGDQIVGKVDTSTFTLKLSKSPPVSIAKPNTMYKGKVTQVDNFSIKVTKRVQDEIEGEFNWEGYGPSTNPAIASFKGKIHKDHIEVLDYKEGKVVGPELNPPFKVLVDISNPLDIQYSIKLN